MSRSTPAECSTSGFTLIEALVALAIVSASLSSIAALIAATVRGSRSIERHLAQLETARAIMTALPDRDQLLPGNFSGETAGHRWRVDVSSFDTSSLNVRQPAWEPQAVVVTVQSLSGGVLQLSSVRLHHGAGG